MNHETIETMFNHNIEQAKHNEDAKRHDLALAHGAKAWAYADVLNDAGKVCEATGFMSRAYRALNALNSAKGKP